MPASPADSALYSRLLGDDEISALFSDTAEVRAMMLVEGTLAKVQGALGLIPPASGDFLHRASFELAVDPAWLAQHVAKDGVPVPALVEGFRRAANAPEHTQWLHWGATSQDICDTAQALRLRRVLTLFDARLGVVLAELAKLASVHADLPMAARTYGQAATPTTFGAVVAQWGRPVKRWRERLGAVTADVALVQLAGASGTLSAMGPRGPEVRAALAAALALHDPGAGWHAERDSIAVLAAWLTGVCIALGKIGEDLILLSQSGIGEVSIAGAGGSSTMPQKQNPVGPSVLVAIARTAVALNSALQGAAMHRQQRDGAAWFTEWLTLPQLTILTGRALTLTTELASRLTPDAAAMSRGLEAGHGLIFAEGLTFALARQMPRPEAQAAVKEMCAEAVRVGTPLLAVAAERFPGTDWAAVVRADMLGTAPAEARAFALGGDTAPM
jgi:3-carboxy-cis,cis-muconate cycloisomerase